MTTIDPARGSITIVAIGPGDPESVPVAAVQAVRGARVLAPPLVDGVQGILGARIASLPEDPSAIPDGAMVVAPDPLAHRLARARLDAVTVPDRERLRARAIGAEVAALAGVGAHLRVACPWDREQTPASIVPHTIEEAFEVAEAVTSGDAEHLLDELGDLLFQTVFQAQLMSEDGGADLAGVARSQTDKLISRHPHVYGEAVAADAARVLDLWERRKREERSAQGIFHELPVGLSALGLAAKAHKRAAAVGFVWPSLDGALGKLVEEVDELREDPGEREAGDVLFAAVAAARLAGADPELALRRAVDRFRLRVTRAAELAVVDGSRFETLAIEGQLAYYERARAEERRG